MLDGKRLATLRAHDGRLTLGLAGAYRLCGILGPLHNRVTIQEDVIQFIAGGRSVFSRHVLDADPALQAGDEVLVVSGDGRLQAIGLAQISGREMRLFGSGVAVQIRKGREQEDSI